MKITIKIRKLGNKIKITRFYIQKKKIVLKVTTKIK